MLNRCPEYSLKFFKNSPISRDSRPVAGPPTFGYVRTSDATLSAIRYKKQVGRQRKFGLPTMQLVTPTRDVTNYMRDSAYWIKWYKNYLIMFIIYILHTREQKKRLTHKHFHD